MFISTHICPPDWCHPPVSREALGSTVNYSSNGSIRNIGINDEGQFTISWNGNRFYPRYNFSPTVPGTNSVNSGLLIYLYYNDEGTLSAGLFSESEWLTNGSYLINNLKSLNRKSRLE